VWKVYYGDVPRAPNFRKVRSTLEAAAKFKQQYSSQPNVDAAEAHPAVDAILGANPFVGLDAQQIAGGLGMILLRAMSRPDLIAGRAVELTAELTRIIAGNSEVEPEKGDRRFTDPAWTDNPLYRRWMQAYLAWRAAVRKTAVDSSPDWKRAELEHFLVTLLTEALAPTNTLPGNPAALKRTFETGGVNLARGLRNFLGDLWNNGGMPSQVDKRPFEVGKNIGISPGAVVHRGELYELIQYGPSTNRVYERPLILVPPQINRFYIMDLAPRRSFTEYAVAHGIQFFMVSWRNPNPANRAWGLDEYVGACKEATEIACEITGSRDCNLIGLCAGGITSSLLLGHLAASERRDGHSRPGRINSATLLVTMLDTSLPSMVGMFATEELVDAAIRRSEAKGVLDGSDMARVFAWLRPNDLVWNYWVNNYLMGNDPAPFDILFWNSDSTNLPAALHAGFLKLMLRNSLTRPGDIEVLGTPVDLRRVDCDMYLLAGTTDHICAWRACYRSTRMFGGRTEFVLSSSGHVQSLVNPPGNFKSNYFVNPVLDQDPDVWLRGATETKGTWWDHWIAWLSKRSGSEREAPTALGSRKYHAVDAAPGRYVLEH